MAIRLARKLAAAVAMSGTVAGSGIAGAQRPPAVAAATPAPPLNWEFRTEQHWLMTIGAEAVVQLVTAGPRPAVILSLDPREADAPMHFGLRVDGQSTGIVLEASTAHSAWSPETFVPIVHGLTPGLKPDLAATIDPALIGTLTDGRVETIARAAVRVSAELAAHRRSPALHEAAALVLAALAMREGHRHFDDPRALLSRATAHLAVADALRGRTGVGQPVPATTSPAGQIARAAVAALAGRQADALALVAAVPPDARTPGVAAWLRAIDVRTRLDWRVLATPAQATLLERLQHARALSARVDGDDALAFVESHEAERVADWSRVLLEMPFSVDAGNTYASEAIDLEQTEASAVHAIVRGTPLDRTSLVAALNQPPARGPRAHGRDTVDVIDWPLWADVLQRHLADAILTWSTHLRTRLGVVEEAEAYERKSAAAYGALRLFPFVTAFNAQQATFVAAMAALEPSWGRPELVPPHAWLMTLERVTRSRSAAIRIAPAGRWFSPVMPAGTVPEDVSWRTHAELGQPIASRAGDLERWRTLAPYKRSLVVDTLALTYGADVPPAAAEQALAPFLAYDIQAIRSIADASADPARREAAYRRICDLTADQCGLLAWHLIDLERDDEAAVVSRRWIDGARDRVMASTSSAWLVDYEHAHGRSAEAWRLATEAASTGSHGGLATLASLAERTGGADKAEALYKRIVERYEIEGPLLSFYLRAHARGETRYEAAAAPLVQKLFPDGLQKVGVADFTTGEAPDRGLTVQRPNRRLQAAGIRDGDVLVAVDGYRVRDFAQWTVVSRLTREPAMTFVYYRNGTYLAASGRFPGRAVAERLRNWIRPARPAAARR